MRLSNLVPRSVLFVRCSGAEHSDGRLKKRTSSRSWLDALDVTLTPLPRGSSHAQCMSKMLFAVQCLAGWILWTQFDLCVLNREEIRMKLARQSDAETKKRAAATAPASQDTPVSSIPWKKRRVEEPPASSSTNASTGAPAHVAPAHVDSLADPAAVAAAALVPTLSWGMPSLANAS